MAYGLSRVVSGKEMAEELAKLLRVILKVLGDETKIKKEGKMPTFEGLISAERAIQDEKWGEQDHEPAAWLTILVEEVGEMATAILCRTFKPNKQKPKDLETELIQCAAVCKAMWECGIRNKWFI